jgi:thioredoxin-dependent peroxiredoxin
MKRRLLIGLLSGALTLPALAALTQGDIAPAFITQASLAGKAVTYSLQNALKKGPVVVYFYPSAYTGGCNLQAHTFAVNKEKFDAVGASIVGVSLDSIERLNDFSADADYCAGKISVASDADGKIAHSYQLKIRPANENFRDSRGNAIGHGFVERTTFVVAANGKIAATIGELTPVENVEKALAAAQRLVPENAQSKFQVAEARERTTLSTDLPPGSTRSDEGRARREAEQANEALTRKCETQYMNCTSICSMSAVVIMTRDPNAANQELTRCSSNCDSNQKSCVAGVQMSLTDALARITADDNARQRERMAREQNESRQRESDAAAARQREAEQRQRQGQSLQTQVDFQQRTAAAQRAADEAAMKNAADAELSRARSRSSGSSDVGSGESKAAKTCADFFRSARDAIAAHCDADNYLTVERFDRCVQYKTTSNDGVSQNYHLYNTCSRPINVHTCDGEACTPATGMATIAPGGFNASWFLVTKYRSIRYWACPQYYANVNVSFDSKRARCYVSTSSMQSSLR